MENKNIITVIGTAIPVNEFEHKGQKFVDIKLITKRLSGTPDSIPVLCKRNLIPSNINIDPIYLDSTDGFRVKIIGQLRTRNVHENNHSKLLLYVYVTEMSLVTDEIEDDNKIELEGVVCKLPVYRITPNKIHITDIFLAVNNTSRPFYIPCIAFNRLARNANKLEVGDIITTTARFQSRTYEKKLENGNIDLKVAYEISLASFEKTGNNKVNKSNKNDIGSDDIDLFD